MAVAVMTLMVRPIETPAKVRHVDDRMTGREKREERRRMRRRGGGNGVE
jgi:hypothetical protein